MQEQMRLWIGIGCALVFLGLVSNAQRRPDKTLFCYVSDKDLTDISAPSFAQFMVGVPLPFTTAKLNLRSNPIAKTFRTVIREDMKHGPNFAGSYRVIVWGCGTSCTQFAVINLRTGNAITVPGLRSLSGVHFEVASFLPRTDSEAGLLRFRKDSRLIVLLGALNENDSKEGAFYYVLKGQKLELVHETIASRGTCAEN